MTQTADQNQDTAEQAERSRRNPYWKMLAGQDPVAALTASPQSFDTLLTEASDEMLTRKPAPGKWSVRDILCHLADAELSFGVRLRQTVADDSYVIQLFDPDAWSRNSGEVTARQALTAFAAIRQWNLFFIKSALPAAADRKVMHPKRGEATFLDMVGLIAGHDINHLRQVEALIAPGA